MFEQHARPKYYRPDREYDFFLLLSDEDMGEKCVVQFWITKINSENDVELLYSYNNNCHGSDRASMAIYKNNRVQFRHYPDGDEAPWGDEEDKVIDTIKDLLTKQIEEALGLR